jgi:6-phosphogluconate dehydrogenase
MRNLSALKGERELAQPDNFGAHTYERVDARGDFHTDWEQA